MESGSSSIDNGGKRMYSENLTLTMPSFVFFDINLILWHMSF